MLFVFLLCNYDFDVVSATIENLVEIYFKVKIERKWNLFIVYRKWHILFPWSVVIMVRAGAPKWPVSMVSARIHKKVYCISSAQPANTRYRPGVASMLVQRLWRWPNIDATSGSRLRVCCPIYITAPSAFQDSCPLFNKGALLYRPKQAGIHVLFLPCYHKSSTS